MRLKIYIPLVEVNLIFFLVLEYLTENKYDALLLLVFMIVGEIIVLFRRRYLGLPLYPFSFRKLGDDFKKRFTDP